MHSVRSGLTFLLITISLAKHIWSLQFKKVKVGGLNMAESSPSELQHPRWKAMWDNGINVGQAFDASSPSPALVKAVLENTVPVGRALVPGCGRGYDIALLANSTRYVLGIDIAEKAVEEAKNYLETLPEENKLYPGSYDIKQLSFFDLPTNTDEEKFDFIYDYTFLCALSPNIRLLWAEKMSNLLKDGGELFTLIFPISELRDENEGPPFKVSFSGLKELLEPHGFEAYQLEMLPIELCHRDRDGSINDKFAGGANSGIGRWKKK